MELPVPILLLGDDPSLSSGLGRILRDLGTLLSGMSEFRVGSLGLGGTGSARLPFVQYRMMSYEMGEVSLPQCWDEFAADKIGVILTIWDWSRLLWLARPEYCELESTRQWLEARRHKSFQLWGYVPVDAAGPNGALTAMGRECLLGFDRLLAYTPFGEQVMRATLGNEEADKRGVTWLGHGLNLKVWHP